LSKPTEERAKWLTKKISGWWPGLSTTKTRWASSVRSRSGSGLTPAAHPR
jgi:hypothetical protein